jgi:hypothetical protein
VVPRPLHPVHSIPSGGPDVYHLKAKTIAAAEEEAMGLIRNAVGDLAEALGLSRPSQKEKNQ